MLTRHLTFSAPILAVFSISGCALDVSDGSVGIAGEYGDPDQSAALAAPPFSDTSELTLTATTPIITSWQAYTPIVRVKFSNEVIVDNPTNMFGNGKFRRVGEDIEAQLTIGSFGRSTIFSGSHWIQISLPAGIETSGSVAGSAAFWDGGRFWTGIVAPDDGHWFRFDFGQPFTGPSNGRLSTNHFVAALAAVGNVKAQVTGWTVDGP